MQPLQHIDITQWQAILDAAAQKAATQQLETGNILFFPKLRFSLADDEQCFLSPQYADPRAKNIGYRVDTRKLWGVHHATESERDRLKQMLKRYAHTTTDFIKHLFPAYHSALIIGRTSFRPVEIEGRTSSYRKDDKRLHVDAFPSAPNQGKRILRVFTNVNPNNQHRVWNVGEPFEEVVNRFLPQIKKPFPGTGALLKFLKITKSYRTLYDHFMLQLHDKMKADEHYQQTVKHTTIDFPSGSSWIVQTDHVSHAALRGQYVLEQTFYLPVEAMENPEQSPLRILENRVGQRLV